LTIVEEFKQGSIEFLGALILRPMSGLVDEDESRTGHALMHFIGYRPRTGGIMRRPEKKYRRLELGNLFNQVINAAVPSV
jgi:hypothetical protein